MTIEERAFDATKDLALNNTARTYYLIGATEQHKIDIDKACEWIKNNLINYFADNNLKISVINRFRKAMEDYQ